MALSKLITLECEWGKTPKNWRIGVDSQFHGTVWEGTQDYGEGAVPGNGPVAMGLDMFWGLTSANGEIKIPDWACSFVFGEGGEKFREDNIKIDCHPCKDMFPFWFWERWEDTAGLEWPKGMFKVCGVILDHSVGVLKILQGQVVLALAKCRVSCQFFRHLEDGEVLWDSDCWPRFSPVGSSLGSPSSLLYGLAPHLPRACTLARIRSCSSIIIN